MWTSASFNNFFHSFEQKFLPIKTFSRVKHASQTTHVINCPVNDQAEIIVEALINKLLMQAEILSEN
jgi:hypothetical protein